MFIASRNDRTCESCRYGEVVFHSTWGKDMLRCMRTRRFKSGQIEAAMGIGANVKFERDNLPESHRAMGDKCTEKGLHWEAKVNNG